MRSQPIQDALARVEDTVAVQEEERTAFGVGVFFVEAVDVMLASWMSGLRSSSRGRAAASGRSERRPKWMLGS